MDELSNIFKNFKEITKQPESFLNARVAESEQLKSVNKSLYDSAKLNETIPNDATAQQALPHLIIEEFDDEQIWQQLELQNNLVVTNLLSKISQIATGTSPSFASEQQKPAPVPTSKRKVRKKRRQKKSVHFKDSSSDEESDDQTPNTTDNRVEIEDRLSDNNIGEERDDLQDGSDENENDDEDDIDALLKRSLGSKLGDDDLSGSEEERMLQELLDRATTDPDGNDESPEESDDGEFGAGFDAEYNEGEDNDDNEDDVDFDFEQPSIKSKHKQSPNSTNKNKPNDKNGPQLDIFGKEVPSEESKFKFGTGKTSAKRKTAVDDKFFKMADMEEFLEIEDAKYERRRDIEEGKRKEEDDDSEGEEEGEEIDMFQDIPSDDEEGDTMKYADFFDPPEGSQATQQETAEDQESASEADVYGEEENEEEEQEDGSGSESEAQSEEDEDEEKENASSKKKKKRNLLQDSSSEGEDVKDILGRSDKSTYSKRKDRISEKITKLEDAAVSEKPWQLTGEIQGGGRPINSLLEHDLEFEQQTKAAPIITEETTKTLEEIIIQRIKDKTFDDVERKVKPKETPYEYKKRIELDQEKSKLSLGQIYEQEYLQQQEEKEEETVDPEREEIKNSMTSLFMKLDALCNFHYTPKAAIPDIEIVSNLPAITVEEVQPSTQSERTTLAPEEIHDKKKQELKGDSEKTRTDKMRARREKKAKQRVKERRRLEREAVLSVANPTLGKKIAQEKAMKDLTKQSKQGRGVTMVKADAGKQKNLTSSTQFFKELQDEVSTHVRAKKVAKTKNDKLKNRSIAKLKL